ncbi:MAG TPA: amidohydrolase family protein [Terrimesophilobacter sp.]|nr:amidohydrolase family protein [Terrimesophilobacter sp.]
MVIDFHTHIQPNTDVEHFLAEMDKESIQLSVVLALGQDQEELEESNRLIASLVQKHPSRLAGFASVTPTRKNAVKDFEELVKNHGFRGLKLHPPIQHFSIDDPRVSPLMEKCAELDLPVLFHTGGVFLREGVIRFGDPLLIDELAIRHPHTKMIIAHGNPFGPDPYIAGKHPNVYLDTTLTFAQIARLIPRIGPEMLDWMRTDEKVLYGSDANPNRTWRFKYNLDPIRDMDIPEPSRAKILGGTARKLLKLD